MSDMETAPPSVSATEGKGRGGNEAGLLLSPPNSAAADAVKFHPLADIFPLMEGEEFDALVADIKANGLLAARDMNARSNVTAPSLG